MVEAALRAGGLDESPGQDHERASRTAGRRLRVARMIQKH
jgi:hypothetical protein